MKILHYSLGVPPYRTGGLTKYSVDLMKSQVKSNHEVILLYPGHFSIFNFNKTRIIKNNDQWGIKVYEIVNPLPVSLLGGISKARKFQKSTDMENYLSFLKKILPDIIHIHTFMGLHKEFLIAAKKLKLKIVYTSHDYFGFCPKVNLIDYIDKICENSDGGEKCARCNLNSYSMNLIFLMQTRIYRNIKDSRVVKYLRSYKKARLAKENKLLIKEKYNSHKGKDKKQNINIQRMEMSKDTINDYIDLRNYYINMFKMIDFFHFNSSIAQNEYRKLLELKGEVISISHSDIKDNRIIRNYCNNNPLKITYLGPISVYKGFYLLKDSLEKLMKEGINNWKLNIYGNSEDELSDYDKNFIIFNGRYNHKDLKNIFMDTDVLVVPSMWRETFGYVALEAYSYAVPAIITDNVGFKDVILNNETGLVISPNIEELGKKIKEIINDRDILRRINKNINQCHFVNSMEVHSMDIINLYRRVISNFM
jgi:glycosyltransferase involved in cell wall biosynthesis